MPELPEVEVVKKSLEEKIKNLTIKRVFINNNKLRYKINNREFYKIKGYKIISIERRYKSKSKSYYSSTSWYDWKIFYY